MGTSKELRIICNADDFGLTRGVSEAIIECHRAGAVTSATWLSNASASGYAAELARQEPSLGVGLHFNLVEGRPASDPAQVPSLVDLKGQFLTRRWFLARVYRGQVKADEVTRELRAQLRAMQEHGLTPTHIDSHQHIHAVPLVFRIVASEARRRGIPIRIPWPWTGAPRGKAWVRRAKEFALRRSIQRSLVEVSIRPQSNDHFCSVFDLPGGPKQLSLESYESLLAPYMSGVVELMVHPARVDAELLSLSKITRVSEMEYPLLVSERLVALVQRRGARLVSYANAWDQEEISG